MKQIRFSTVWLATALLLAACHKKADPVADMEKIAAALATPSPAATPGDPNAGPPPAKEMQEVIAEYKAGKMEEAVTRLQMLRNQSNVTVDQRMAIQDGVAAVMNDIYTKAEQGDPRAIAAVQRFQALRGR